MKQIEFIISVMVVAMVLSFGCSQKSDEATDKVPLETKKAEMKDTTRLDAADYKYDSTYMDTH